MKISIWYLVAAGVGVALLSGIKKRDQMTIRNVEAGYSVAGDPFA